MVKGLISEPQTYEDANATRERVTPLNFPKRHQATIFNVTDSTSTYSQVMLLFICFTSGPIAIGDRRQPTSIN